MGHALQRRITAITVLCVAAALATWWGGSQANAVARSSQPSLAGTWSGSYSGAFSGTFTLHWTQARSVLSGSITLSTPQGKYNITGRMHGRAITFGAVGAGATYTGTISGNSMSGTYSSLRGGGPWRAHKTG